MRAAGQTTELVVVLYDADMYLVELFGRFTMYCENLVTLSVNICHFVSYLVYCSFLDNTLATVTDHLTNLEWTV